VRAVVSRVVWARVVVEREVVGEIGAGLLVRVGVAHDDGPAEAAWLADKVATLRVLADAGGKMNRSLGEGGGGALVVSQFTLYGDARRGRRPSFVAAARPDRLAAAGIKTATGRFGAEMTVESAGDGPVTILLDSARSF
jgi:D-aminoacyl-tRNA deacylase